MSEISKVESRLAEVRKKRGLTASELARRVNVSRQTIYAIEAGTYVPNTEVALRLAQELEVSVDELFRLRGATPSSTESMTAEVLSADSPVKGQGVRICQVGSRLLSIPVSASPCFLPEADGVIEQPVATKGHAQLRFFGSEEAAQSRLVLAGCDPATSLLARMVERVTGVEVVCAGGSSKLALNWLVADKVHIAGSHLEDAKTGEFNVPFLRKNFPGNEFTVVTFAQWEEGLVVAKGNPKRIRKVEDLCHRGVRFMNRETGSGSRALLDELIHKAGIAPQKVAGYDRVALGHLAAAWSVLAGEADACLATRSAAQTFGLGFFPLRTERYDLIMRKQTADMTSVKAFLDVLQLASLRRKLEGLAGYDTTHTGSIVCQ